MRKRFFVGFAVLAGLYLLGSPGKEARQSSSPPHIAFRPIQTETNAAAEPLPVNLEPAAPAIVHLPENLTPMWQSAAAQPKRAFIRGKAVALRNGPAKNFQILDRFDAGREVDVLGTDGEWAQVRDGLTQREGWVFASLLSDVRPERPQQDAEPAPKQKPAARAVPDIPESLVIQRLIAASIANYPGSCACPENYDRAGRRCGKRSAWAKGGGYAPLCYASDITPAMISAFRER